MSTRVWVCAELSETCSRNASTCARTISASSNLGLPALLGPQCTGYTDGGCTTMLSKGLLTPWIMRVLTWA